MERGNAPMRSRKVLERCKAPVGNSAGRSEAVPQNIGAGGKYLCGVRIYLSGAKC